MSYQPKTNWQLDDIVMPDDMNRIENGIVNLENNVDTKATKATYTAIIPTTGWVASGSLQYRVNVTVTGILASDNPIISPNLSSIQYAVDQIKCSEEWNKILTINTYPNTLQVFTIGNEIPTVEIPIKIMCIR